MTALAVPDLADAPPLVRLRHALADGLAVTRRNLSHVRRVPEKLIDVTLQPIMFTLLFVYVFGPAIAVPGGDYVSYLMAGIFVQTLTFGAASSAVSIADDLSKGVIERFRALPMARSAVLVGRTTADAAANLLGLAVLVATGFVAGWRIDAGVPSALAALAILFLFAYAMSWAGTLLGLCVRTPDAAQGVMFIAMFPLTFLANTFVPTGALSPVLGTIAEWNPVSAVVAACRHLFGNTTALPTDPAWPLQHPVPAALGWTALILAVCVPLAIRRYRIAAAR
jgi:ABC-2 type transport system permease protein